ncbi:MAG: DNA primase, partial [Pseudomonadota bacterium]
MRFSQNFLEEIRARIPIADVVGRRVTFDRKKSNPSKGDFWACCPFHGEKSPSFHCENAKGRYHCFGCGASGDHFRFMTELDGLSFPEAVERLAEEAGVPMPAVDPKAEARERKRASLYDVMTMAAAFFQQQLQTADGAKARAYLRDRGLSTGVQQAFGLGYAPQSRSALKEHLAAKGVEKEKIEACGLVVFGPEIAVSYDRFRDRIMFPILDARERVIAFGGRALSADVPAKYLNSPETDLFSKSNVLYNYARARKASGKDGSLIVCEGYMDVIALAAAGFENAVAPLGTALTENQLELAWRVSREPILCFDGDSAGRRAAEKSVDLILPRFDETRGAKFIALPTGQDPDDFLKSEGPAAFGAVCANAMPLSEFILHRRLTGALIDTPEQKVRVEKALMQDVFSIKDQGMSSHMRKHVRTRLSAIFYGRDFGKSHTQDPAQKIHFIGPTMREKLILGVCVAYPILMYKHIEDIVKIDFRTKKYREFQRELFKLIEEWGDLDVVDIYAKISPYFYDVLEEVHGFPINAGEENFDGSTIKWSRERGYALKINFPMLRHNPPLILVEKFLVILLRQYQESDFEHDLGVQMLD